LPGETSSELAGRHQTDEILNENMAAGLRPASWSLSLHTAHTAHRIASVFIMLESINFAKIRNEFECAATWVKIEAGEDPLEVALKITGQFAPSVAIAEKDLEILIPVLNVIAQVAVNGAPSLIPRSQQPLRYDPVTGQLLNELVRHIHENHPAVPHVDGILASGVPRATDKAGDLCDDVPPEKAPPLATRSDPPTDRFGR
jgi:hypothetical protein